MSTRRGAYEAMVAEAKPSHARMMKPYDKLSEAQKEALFGAPDKGPDEKVKAKKQTKKTAKKKASRKKAK